MNFQEKENTVIGEVESVSGNSLTIRMFDNVKSNMPVINGVVYRVGQVGSFLKVRLGYSDVYGLVTQVGAAALPESLRPNTAEDYAKIGNTRWLSLVLIGEQSAGRFERGVTQIPTTGDKVHLVTVSDLDVIYGGYNEMSAITIGNISASESLSAKIDLDKLISRHCAILGSTGSGKSNAVSVLLESIANKDFRTARIMVIDPHGEYSESLKHLSKVYRINAEEGFQELTIPFWALPYDELLSIFPTQLNDQNREYVREKVIDLKRRSIKSNRLELNPDIVTADTPMPFSIKKLWFELDDFERQTFEKRAEPGTVTTKRVVGDPEKLISNDYQPASAGGGAPFLNNAARGILRFLDGVRIKLKDSRYSFLFEPKGFAPDLDGKVEKDLDTLLFSWLGHEMPITILDLSGVPSDVMSSISGTLLKVIYDFIIWGQKTPAGGKEQPLLVVLEEAHSYLKSGEDSIASRAVQTIAKEGRKYGMGLVLVTQRPSELDETVLSQCGTMIALRMNNNKDRGHIRAAVQDELQTIIDLLPSLRTGEAIISGESVKIPTRVQFFRMTNAVKGSDPKASEKWKEPLPNDKDYALILDHWRRQSFNKEDKGGKK